jgi:hypothetical protein
MSGSARSRSELLYFATSDVIAREIEDSTRRMARLRSTNCHQELINYLSIPVPGRALYSDLFEHYYDMVSDEFVDNIGNFDSVDSGLDLTADAPDFQRDFEEIIHIVPNRVRFYYVLDELRCRHFIRHFNLDESDRNCNHLSLLVQRWRAIKRHARDCDSNFLVGIETNPGPTYDNIIRFLKNQERAEPAASSIRRQAQRHPQEDLVKRFNQKLKSIQMRNSRRSKDLKLKFYPEGYFDVGIDAESKVFLSSLLRDFSNVIGQGININVDWSQPIVVIFNNMISAMRSISESIYDWFMFFFYGLRDILTGRVKELLDYMFPLFFPEGGEVTTFMMIAYRKYIYKYLSESDFRSLLDVLSSVKSMATNVEDIISHYLTLSANMFNTVFMYAGVTY